MTWPTKCNAPLCDQCGRMIPFADLDAGEAVHRLVTPDSEFTRETYESLCRDHLSVPPEGK